MLPALYSLKKNKLKPQPLFKSSKNSLGFTLIELLVVIAIMGFLTGGAIVAYNDFNQAQTVRRSALGLVSDIRETQIRAVAGVKDAVCKVDFYNSNTGMLELSEPQDNIEDYQLDGHYLIFDITPMSGDDAIFQRQQSCTEAVESGQEATPDNLQLPIPPEIFNLLTNITISDMDLVDSMGSNCTGGSDVDQLTINFEPLKGVEFYEAVGIGGAAVGSGCLTARIDITDGTTNYRIEVDKSGQVNQKRRP